MVSLGKKERLDEEGTHANGLNFLGKEGKSVGNTGRGFVA